MGRSKEAMHCGRNLLLFYVEEAPMEYEDFRYLKDWDEHYQMLGFGRFANHNGKVVSVEGSKQCPVCGPFHDAKVHLDIVEDVY